MGFETPKMPTPEGMAKIQKERALSDAELIKGGAEYVVDEKGMRLDVTYEQIKEAEKEMKQENQESPKIKLPKDPEIIKKLQNKLRDYKQRFASEQQKIDGHKAPEQVFHILADTNYKIAVLEKVLLEGEASTHELSRELNAKDGQFDAHAFNNACGVVEDYCSTGGKNTRGGTGF
jgi:hypothetical protein